MYRVRIEGEEREYAAGTSYREIVKDYQEKKEYTIVLVTVDGKLQELHKKLKKDCEIKLVTTAEDRKSVV